MIAPWAMEEAGRADFGDTRLDERMARLLLALGNRPFLSIPAACSGRAEMKAAYRFFDNDKTTFEKVTEPHFARTKPKTSVI
jgi:Transposase DNA-binding